MSDLVEQNPAYEGLVSSMRKFIKTLADEEQAASAISLEAIRGTHPDLAKRIFIEAVTKPARELLAVYKYPDANMLLDELEARVRQDSMPILFGKVEQLVATRLLWSMFETQTNITERIYQQGVRDQAGNLSSAGFELFRWNVDDLIHVLGKLAAVRERRVQLCLAAALVGEEKVREVLARHGGYKRELLIHTIWQWLGPNMNNQKRRLQMVEWIKRSGVSDEQIERCCNELIGTSFLGERGVQTLFYEIFNHNEHIEF